MDLHRLGDDVADRHARIERGVRILENHLQVAAHLAHVAAVELGQILALKDDLALGRLVELQNRAAGGRLAATRLADEPQCLTLLDIERDAVDRLNRANLPLEDDSPRQREMHDQIVDSGASRRAIALRRSQRRAPRGDVAPEVHCRAA